MWVWGIVGRGTAVQGPALLAGVNLLLWKTA